MRSSEFIIEAEKKDHVSTNVLTALRLLQVKIREGDLKPKVRTDLVIRYIKNTGLTSFSYEDLIAANETDSAIKNILSNITPEFVTVSTSTKKTVKNPDNQENSVANPEQTVSKMAKSAMKRRQS